jgi:hypothetical protein
VTYYNEARTNLSLDKDAPIPREVQGVGRIFAKPHLGGLHPPVRPDLICDKDTRSNAAIGEALGITAQAVTKLLRLHAPSCSSDGSAGLAPSPPSLASRKRRRVA